MTWDPADRDERIAAIESFLSNWMAAENVPGLSASLTTSDGPVWAAGFGSRNLASNEPATPETIYGVGSITKSFTALAVLRLAARGSFSLEDPITDHLEIELPAGATPTIDELLTHRSGFPSLGTSSVLIARLAGIGEMGVPLGDRDDLYQHIAAAKDEFDPDGERFMYSNEGYILLADLVEEVDGRPMAEYLTAELLGPLGMERSTFSRGVFRDDPDTITPYRFEDGEPTETDLPVRELSHGPGGLLAPVTDVGRYLRLQLERGSIGGRPLVEAPLLERAWEPRVETPIGPYGYGWRTRELHGQKLVGHSGSISVSTAYAGFLPDADLGVVVAANISPGVSLRYVGEAIAAGALGLPPRSTPFFERLDRLEELTGDYETYRGVRSATVERRGGVLELTFSDVFGEQRTTLIPTDLTVDVRRFETIGAAGERWPAEFVEADGTRDLFLKRWRLHKI